jgi:hypothetical protein
MVSRFGARLRNEPALGLVLSLVLFAYATDDLGGGQLQYLFRFSGSPGHVL